jgi:hypothetical protein
MEGTSAEQYFSLLEAMLVIAEAVMVEEAVEDAESATRRATDRG